MRFIYYEELKAIWSYKRKGGRPILVGQTEHLNYARKKLGILHTPKNIELLKKYYNKYMREKNEKLLDV